MKYGGCVYIMCNQNDSVLYIGVTSDLKKRIYEHKNHLMPGSFTHKYKINKLVYYEVFHKIEDAIVREKQLKAGSRKKKLDLVNGFNPEWVDLYEQI